MQASIRLAHLRRFYKRPTLALLPFAAFLCCGCDQEFPTLNQTSPVATRVNAIWPGQPLSAAQRYGSLYGTCVDVVTDGLLLAHGEQPSWKANVVVCTERILTAAQAHLLAETATDIFLPNLEILTPAAAQALAATTGILSVPKLQSLSWKTAVALGGRREALVLTGVLELSAQAADGLALCEGPLKLDGLTELAPGVAKALARHVGPLALNGVKQLNVADGKALARHRGDVCLNGMKVLSDEAAEALAGLPYGLHLNEVERISIRAADALASHRGWCLGLNGLRADRLPQEVAATLNQHRRVSHCLGGLPVRL
jgi:hypothetical protein